MKINKERLVKMKDAMLNVALVAADGNSFVSQQLRSDYGKRESLKNIDESNVIDQISELYAFSSEKLKSDALKTAMKENNLSAKDVKAII